MYCWLELSLSIFEGGKNWVPYILWLRWHEYLSGKMDLGRKRERDLQQLKERRRGKRVEVEVGGWRVENCDKIGRRMDYVSD
jgi:hypothetical protein